MLQMIRKTKAWVENVDFGDNEQNLSAFYVQAIALVLIIGAILIGITYAIVGNVGYVILMMLVVVTHILVIVLTRRKSLNSAIYLFLIFSLGLEIYGLFLAGGIHATSSVLFPVILIFSSLLLDRKRFLIYTTFCLGAIAFIIYAENQKISQPYVPDQPELPLFISFGLIFVVTAIFVRFITENLQTNLRNTWQREQELATQNEILNRIGQAVVACASNSTITYWNQAASEYYGWNANDTLGKEYATILPVTNSPETMQMIDAALSAGKVWSGELNVKKRDQTLLRTLNTIAPLHNNQGHMTGWVGIAADLSERQQAELALQESEAKFHGFFNHSLDSMFLVDDNGLILEINQATEALFQLTREEAIGKPVWEIQFIRATDDVRTTTSMEAIRDIVEKATRTGLAPWLNRVTHSAIQLSDGAIRYIQQTSFTIPHGNKFWIAIISHDVTESRKVEDAIRMLNVEFEKRVE
jgi:PAS domain S-box-containing protein